MAGYTCVKGGIIPVDCLYTLCSIYAYDRELASGASVSLDDADDNDDDDDDESMNRWIDEVNVRPLLQFRNSHECADEDTLWQTVQFLDHAGTRMIVDSFVAVPAASFMW